MCVKLKPFLKQKGIRNTISVERRLALTLVKLGSCGELRTIANLFGVARSTTCCIIKEVCLAICKSFEISFPTGSELQKVAEGFHSKGSLPGCCGALDGSHIPIKAPSQNAKDYFCRKQFYSIVLQAVADSSASFISINVGWPGSVHDARVFRNSRLYLAGAADKLFLPQTVHIQNEEIRPFLVADQAYPTLSWLKKPHGGILNDHEIAFNKKLSAGRISVEHAFGQLKGRWRCLLKENDAHIENVRLQILTCSILHNLCKKENDEFIEDWNYDSDTEVMP